MDPCGTPHVIFAYDVKRLMDTKKTHSFKYDLNQSRAVQERPTQFSRHYN